MKALLHPIIAAAVLATAQFCTVSGATRCVWLDSPNPTPPYTDWLTAATSIQDAVDIAEAGEEVLVTNGVYQTGARAVDGMSNRVAVTKPMTVRSVNGPAVTQIVGSGWEAPEPVRCVHLAEGAVLAGFTLTNGATQTSGGGVWCAGPSAVVSNCVLTANWTAVFFGSGGGAWGGTLNNCTLTGNWAGGAGGGACYGVLNNCVLTGNATLGDGGGALSSTLNNCTLTGNSAGTGGGAYGSTLNNCALTANSADDGGGTGYSTLNNCTLTDNSAREFGGGAFFGTLNNCTLAGNSAGLAGSGACGGTLNNCTLTGNSARENGGGAFGGTLNNCIVYYNSARNWGANYFDATLNYCCTAPLPSQGEGNVIKQPSFVNTNGWVNLRLEANSPCIDAGNNAWATAGSTDLDGRPRIVGGKADIGAYEFQGPNMGEFVGWLQRYGLPTDGSADTADTDADRLNSWQEWCCQTDPTNPLSVLRLLSATPAGNDVLVTWTSVAGVSYVLERSTDLGGSPRFTPLAANLPGSAGTNTFTDTDAAALPSVFYRVGVNLP